MTSSSIQEFMTPDTLMDLKNRGGWGKGERTGTSPNPDTRFTTGTAEDEGGN